jgi:uncharacterized SAM-binding protein YcdF (DUF218 family)
MSFLATACAIANLWRKRPERPRGLWFVTASFAGLAVVCTPLLGRLAIGSLEWAYPPRTRRPPQVEAIVVLGGYLRPPDAEYGRFEPELWWDSRDRCRLAAHYYHDGPPCWLVVTGGQENTESGPSLAQAMKDFLVQRKVAGEDVIVEDRSRSTYENAVNTAPLLKDRGVHRIALVTDATHLLRAERCFRAQGFEVVPCGAFYSVRRMEWSLSAFLPSPGAVGDLKRASHEWLGLLWYHIKGRI